VSVLTNRDDVSPEIADPAVKAMKEADAGWPRAMDKIAERAVSAKLPVPAIKLYTRVRAVFCTVGFTPNPAAPVAWSTKCLSLAGSVSPIAAKATIVLASFRRAITSSLGLSFRSSSHACSNAD
jgi:hypothetical protein